MEVIRFGTDGWRAIIAKEFTVDNVARITIATGKWLLNKYREPKVVIGYDCRFGGQLFAEVAAKVLSYMNIKVFLTPSFVSTPMVSLGILKLKAQAGIVITASHNHYLYNGFKLKGKHGGPMIETDIKEIESLIPPVNNIPLDEIKINELIQKKQIEYIDMETKYLEHVYEYFDIDKIKSSAFKFAFDAMYGAGQNIMKRIMPEITSLHCELNPTFKGIAPEPLHKNLQEFSELIKKTDIDCGLAVDGDADRIALYDENGNYVDSHHIILLLIHYFAKYKKMKGKVVTGFSSTVKVEKLCGHYGLEVQRVRIGFKDICRIMLQEDILVGGEESGGITVKTHIPERDGIWMGLTIWQFMTETNKLLSQLVDEVYQITGKFGFARKDIPMEDEKRKKIVDKCKNKEFTHFGKYKITHVQDIDGYKFFFNENEWCMIRPSGTEPLLRLYAESTTVENAENILKQTFNTIMV